MWKSQITFDFAVLAFRNEKPFFITRRKIAPCDTTGGHREQGAESGCKAKRFSLSQGGRLLSLSACKSGKRRR